MNRWNIKKVLLTIVLIHCATVYTKAQANQSIQERALAGAWQGTLAVGGASLRIVFHFVAAPQGGYKATFDSPDQGAFGISTDTVIVQDTTIRVLIKAIAGEFKGTRSANADSISGTWSQGGVQLPLVVRSTSSVQEAPKRPQEPKKPYPYIELEVTFHNLKAGVTLAGTLTFPSQGGPFPAVILITGSGPQDRDESVFGHKPFLVFSDYLTRRGIAVLRYDDRGTGKSTGSFKSGTSRDFADDAGAAVAFLKTRKEVRSGKIGIVGHSEGGIIAPLLAAESKDVAFIVMMAGTGVPGDEIIYKQAVLIALAAGATEEQVKQQQSQRKKFFAVLKSGKDTTATAAELRRLMKAEMDSTMQSNPQAAEAAIDAQIGQLNSLWFRHFLIYDPRPALMKVRCPVLAINGEKDLQVSPKQNLPEIEAALRAGKNKDFTVQEIPGLNHLFQTASTGAPSEYGKIEETISPTALKMIADWILERSR